MPGKSSCIPSLDFASPVPPSTFPCPRLVCLAGAESCLGQGWFRQLRFQQQHLSRAFLCFFSSLQSSCPCRSILCAAEGPWEHHGCCQCSAWGSPCVGGPLGPHSKSFVLLQLYLSSVSCFWGINPLCSPVTDAMGAEGTGPACFTLLPRADLWFNSCFSFLPACPAVPGPRMHWIPTSCGLGKGRSN